MLLVPAPRGGLAVLEVREVPAEVRRDAAEGVARALDLAPELVVGRAVARGVAAARGRGPALEALERLRGREAQLAQPPPRLLVVGAVDVELRLARLDRRAALLDLEERRVPPMSPRVEGRLGPRAQGLVARGAAALGRRLLGRVPGAAAAARRRRRHIVRGAVARAAAVVVVVAAAAAAPRLVVVAAEVVLPGAAPQGRRELLDEPPRRAAVAPLVLEVARRGPQALVEAVALARGVDLALPRRLEVARQRRDAALHARRPRRVGAEEVLGDARHAAVALGVALGEERRRRRRGHGEVRVPGPRRLAHGSHGRHQQPKPNTIHNRACSQSDVVVDATDVHNNIGEHVDIGGTNLHLDAFCAPR